VAIHGGGVQVQGWVQVHDPGQAHDSAAGQSLGRGAADRPESDALDNDIDIDIDVGGVAGVIPRAEIFDEITFPAGLREVDDVHLVAALDAEQACHQPDRPGAGDQRPAPLEERAPRDLVDLVPGLSQNRRWLQQNAEFAELREDGHGEIRLHAPVFASVPMQADDPALAEAVVPAHVPFPCGTCGARYRIRPADDADDEIAGREARSRWCLDHLAETLVADDQPFFTAWRGTVGAVRDLPVGPADTDRPPAHQQSTIVQVRMRDLLDTEGTFLARPYCHCAHVLIVIPGSRSRLTRQRVMTDATDTPDDRVMISSAPEPFDVVVVGAGPAGVVAALRAARLGARTALITRDQFGGMAANDGPVPVRTLAQAARLIREARKLPQYGIAASEPALDYPRLLARVREVTAAAREQTLLRGDLERAGVIIHEQAGPARFTDAHTIESDYAPRLRAGKVILCTGGTARPLPVPGFGLTATHSDAWSLSSVPPSMLVIGAGATGVQVASIFNAFGSRVHLVEVGPRILMSEDRDVSEAVAAALAASGVQI